jgi:hypothetical protein
MNLNIARCGPITCLLLIHVAASGEPIPQPPRQPTLNELIRALGSEDFHEREEATRRLSEMKMNVDEPPPALIEATRSSDPEVRKRALEIIKLIRHRAAERMLGRGRAFATKGNVDLFIAATKTWELPEDDDRLWQPALDLAKVIAKHSEYGPSPPFYSRKKFGSMVGFRQTLSPRMIRSDQPLTTSENRQVHIEEPGGIMAPGVLTSKGLRNNVIVARGSICPTTCISTCIIFANGDVTVGTHVTDTLVVCDGDVTVEDEVVETIILARGNIRIKSFAKGSLLLAGGNIKLGASTQGGTANRVQEKLTKDFVAITFFELSTVGVEVNAADSAVRVSTITDGKPFAKAGIRAGDVIHEVNGKKPDSAESLRRLLRDALAVGDATVKLRRGEKTETVKVSLPE